MTVRTTKLATSLAALALAAGLSACGSSTATTSTTTAGTAAAPASGAASSAAAPASTSAAASVPDAPSLWKQVQASTASATSVHVVGNTTDKGAPLKVDIAGDRKGSNQKAVVDMGAKGVVEVITVDGFDYIRGDKAYWASQGNGQVDDALAKLYLKVPQTGSDFSVGSILDEIAKTSLNTIDVVNLKVDKSDVSGTPAYLISERVPGKSASKIWVSTDGKASVLRIDSKDDQGQPGSLLFTEWNAVKPVTAPPADQING